MFASPSFYLANKISPLASSKRIYEAFIHCVNISVCVFWHFWVQIIKKKQRKVNEEEPPVYIHPRKAINSGTQRKIEGRSGWQCGRRSYYISDKHTHTHTDWRTHQLTTYSRQFCGDGFCCPSVLFCFNGYFSANIWTHNTGLRTQSYLVVLKYFGSLEQSEQSTREGQKKNNMWKTTARSVVRSNRPVQLWASAVSAINQNYAAGMRKKQTLCVSVMCVCVIFCFGVATNRIRARNVMQKGSISLLLACIDKFVVAIDRKVFRSEIQKMWFHFGDDVPHHTVTNAWSIWTIWKS